MKRFFAYALITSVFTMTIVSCGKDDDKEPSQGGTLLPIPVSVVDGVRVASVKMGNTDFSKCVYNQDGSIASVSINGVKYDFEYASTRASRVQYTNSKLENIRITNEEGTEKGYGFVFDEKTGFVTQWTEYGEYRDGPYYEKGSGLCTVTYNPEGRISKLSYNGKYEWNDPEDSGSEPINAVIHYNYKGGNLVTSTYEIPDEGKSVFTLGYGNGPVNSFNIAPYPLYYAMGHGEACKLAGMLAYLGYLGLPSATLPTSYSYRVDDYEDMSATMSYHTNSIGQVTSMDMSINGYQPVKFDISYLSY